MKILHTADWHLNDRLGRIDRTSDLRTAVERIATQVKEQKADVLIVAGDLFSELARPDALRETIFHWREVFAGFLADGGTILTCTGNHDSETFCQTLRHAMILAAPSVGGQGELVPNGRFYLAADPTLLRLHDRHGKGEVQFILMPYPTPMHYLGGEAGQKYDSPEAKNGLLVSAFENKIQELRQHPKFDPALPAVLIGHANVYGAVMGDKLFRMNIEDDVVVDGKPFAEQFAYVALGHIHKPQFLGHEHIRYSGSIEKMDLGESNDTKSSVVFELDAEGKARDIEVLPLPSTPIYEMNVNDPATDIPRLKQEFEGAERDLVKLNIRYTAGQDHLEEILRDLERIFPRWYARDWIETSKVKESLTPAAADRSKSFGDTVRDYLKGELMQHSEAERAELLQLAEELMIDG
jgi:exonuclease SbcD